MIITTTKELRKRDPNDHYPTPSGLIRAAYAGITGTPARILDPGAGTGVWGAVARSVWPSAHITGVELQPSAASPAYDDWYGGWDFGRYVVHHLVNDLPKFDLIVGNPPYKFAEHFILLSLMLLNDGGELLQDLRLAFLEGQDRGKGLWKKFGPVAVDTLSRRPSHTRKKITVNGEDVWIPDGKTDSTAYACFYWQKGNYPNRYSGGWLQWEYGDPIPEDKPFRPFKLLCDSQMVIEQKPYSGQLNMFDLVLDAS